MAVPDRSTTSAILFSIGMANIPVSVREAVTEPYERGSPVPGPVPDD